MPAEIVRIEDIKQCAEAVRMAIVWSCRKKQLVLKTWSDISYRTRYASINCIL